MVADTDILIDYLRDKGPFLDVVDEAIERGRLMTTAVNRFELMSGARTPQEKDLLTDLLASIPSLPLDELAADEAALIRRSLEERGQPIGYCDSLIAGIVRLHGYPLLTRDRKHFERVDGLILL
jgi:tRNA(fMet)-specific endonuclease VapC